MRLDADTQYPRDNPAVCHTAVATSRPVALQKGTAGVHCTPHHTNVTKNQQPSHHHSVAWYLDEKHVSGDVEVALQQCSAESCDPHCELSSWSMPTSGTQYPVGSACGVVESNLQRETTPDRDAMDRRVTTQTPRTDVPAWIRLRGSHQQTQHSMPQRP